MGETLVGHPIRVIYSLIGRTGRAIGQRWLTPVDPRCCDRAMALAPLGTIAVLLATLVLPPTGGTTTTPVLDHAALLGDVAEPEWYEANIPFVDVPDPTIRDTYYYRWRTFKEALKY